MITEHNIYSSEDITSLTLYRRNQGGECVIRGKNEEITVPEQFLTVSEYLELLNAAMDGDEPMQRQLTQLKLIYALMKKV